MSIDCFIYILQFSYISSEKFFIDLLWKIYIDIKNTSKFYLFLTTPMHEITGYIHINEASKVYNKTRQTFYNYITRNLIRTKKVNNKVFLHRGDIELLLSNYIDEAGDAVLPQAEVRSEVIVVQPPIPTPSAPSAQPQPSNDWLYIISDLKQELFMDNRNQLFTLQQTVQKATQETILDLHHALNALQKKYLQSFVSLKKAAFVLGYMGFVIVNVLIISHLP